MKTTIVAEIGSNWEGSVSRAKKIIEECEDAGADAVKFQMWRAKDLYSITHPQWNVIKKSELTFEKATQIKKISDSMGIEFFCSIFSWFYFLINCFAITRSEATGYYF